MEAWVSGVEIIRYEVREDHADEARHTNHNTTTARATSGTVVTSEASARAS